MSQLSQNGVFKWSWCSLSMPWKSLGNKEGWWEICHFTSTQKSKVIIIASPALAYLDKKYNRRQDTLSLGWRGYWGTELVGGNKGLFSKLSRSLKKIIKNPIHGELSGSLPLKWSKHSLQWHPDGAAQDNAHFIVPRGGRQGVAPATVLHIAGTWRGNPPLCQLLWWSSFPLSLP